MEQEDRLRQCKKRFGRKNWQLLTLENLIIDQSSLWALLESDGDGSNGISV